jgi:hypothetical protein
MGRSEEFRQDRAMSLYQDSQDGELTSGNYSACDVYK